LYCRHVRFGNAFVNTGTFDDAGRENTLLPPRDSVIGTRARTSVASAFGGAGKRDIDEKISAPTIKNTEAIARNDPNIQTNAAFHAVGVFEFNDTGFNDRMPDKCGPESTAYLADSDG
jgi:hypothetical protein